MPMTISTFLYFNDNTCNEEPVLLPFDEDFNLEEFYIEPPLSLVESTIQAIKNL